MRGHMLVVRAEHWYQSTRKRSNEGVHNALELTYNQSSTTCWVPDNSQHVAAQQQDQAKQWKILASSNPVSSCWERWNYGASPLFPAIVASKGTLIPLFFPLLPFSQPFSGLERFRQTVPACSPRNNNLVDSGRREQTGMWKWGFLRKSAFPHETPQVSDGTILRARASLNALCISQPHLWSLWTSFWWGMIQRKNKRRSRRPRGSLLPRHVGFVCSDFTLCQCPWQLNLRSLRVQIQLVKVSEQFRCLSEAQLSYAE